MSNWDHGNIICSRCVRWTSGAAFNGYLMAGYRGFEAMNAMLIYSWSTAMLTGVLLKLNIPEEMGRD